MKSLIEELKNNFIVKELSPKETLGKDYKILRSNVCKTHDRAIRDLLKKIGKRGIILKLFCDLLRIKEKQITLPYSPPCFVIDNRGGEFTAVLNYMEKK